MLSRIIVTANECNAVAILILNEFDHMLKARLENNTVVCI